MEKFDLKGGKAFKKGVSAAAFFLNLIGMGKSVAVCK